MRDNGSTLRVEREGVDALSLILAVVALCSCLALSVSSAPSAKPSAKPAAEAAEEEFDPEFPTTGGIVKFGEAVLVAEGEHIEGPVVAVGSNIRVDGSVNGPVVALGGTLELGPRAEVSGPAVAVGGRTRRAAGSRVEGPIVDTPGSRVLGKLFGALATLGALSASLYLLAKLSAGIGWVVLAVVLAALFPEPLKATKEGLERRLPDCALVGFLAWPALAVISLTLSISIIGLPLVPFLLALAAAAYVWGFASLSLFLGDKLAKDRWDNMLVSVLIGVLTLKLLQWVPVAKWLVCLAAAVPGMGAAVVTRFGFRPAAPRSAK